MKEERRRFNKVALFLCFTLTLVIPSASWLSQAQGQRMTKLNLGYVRVADQSPLFLAVDKGFGKEEGLELNLTPMVGGAAVAPALASGALHIGVANVVSIVIAHTKGFDFKFIANGAINKARSNETFGIQVLRDSPLRIGKDLEGKVVATNTLQNTVHLSTLYWVDKHGGDSSKVKIVEMPFPAMEGALRDKKIDAFTAAEPFVAIPSGRTTKVIGVPLGEIAPRLLIFTYFSSGEWADKNADTARAFIRALNKGMDYHYKNLEEAKVSIAKWTGLDPGLVGKVTLPVFEKEHVLSDIQPWIDLSHKYKFIDKPFKAEELLHRLALVKR